MADTLLRHWHLLQSIPRAPAKRDVASLHGALEAAGYKITRRQLQRDLNTLSRQFPLQNDARPPAFGWSWIRDASPMDLPAMDARTALVLKLVERFIPRLLPPILEDQLRPYFHQADKILKSGRSNGLARWTDCVRVVPREMPLLPPKFDRAATRIAYDALLMGKRFSARYASRSVGGGAPTEYEISPLGLVVRGNLIYLICTLWNYHDLRQLAVHRLSRARLLEKAVKRSPNFDLDEYIQRGEFQYPVGPMIRLTVLFEKDAAAHLTETPLSEDQMLEEMDDGRIAVTATVRDSQQLEWWLRGFGDAAEVVAPATISRRRRA